MSLQRVLTVLSVCSLFVVVGIAKAQEGDSGVILLPETQAPPPARVSTHKTAKVLYQDESVRSERSVAILSDETFVNDGSYVEYYRDGQKYCEGTYKMGAFDGQWQYWYPNGQLCKTVAFNRGLPGGEWQVFRDDGTLASKKGYRGGKKQGSWTYYFDDGKQAKLEVAYDAGKVVGEQKTFFPDGKIRQVIQFKDGLLHGTMTEWNESGEKTAEAKFVDGKREGEVVRFENVPGIGIEEIGVVSPENGDGLSPLNETDQGQEFGVE